MPVPAKYRKALLPVIAMVVALALVRYFEWLFYDPFRLYFSRDFYHVPVPEFEGMRLLANFFLRYWLNTAISMAILYALFNSRPQLVFAGFLYLAFFIVLCVAFFAVVHYAPEEKMALFYIRRFLIQPLLLLLFIPAFIYQNRMDR